MPAIGTRARAKPIGRLGTNVLRSEWTKIRTVRSTYWTMLITVVSTIGLSAMVSAIYVGQYDKLSAAERSIFNAASYSLVGGILAQLAIAVLGVLVITGEYGTGMIRTTLAAVPQRLKVLSSKATVFTAMTLVVTMISCFIAFFIGQAIFSAKGLDVGLGDPGVLRTVIGTSLYLAVLGLLALGLGTLIRKTAGAISAIVGILFVLPVLTSLLPSSMSVIEKYMPSNAGEAIINGGVARGDTASLSPWVGLGVFFLWAAVALIAGAFRLVHRDA
jgi:ABC-type transport system involved in multi-copper enzyme maturation permease subunit